MKSRSIHHHDRNIFMTWMHNEPTDPFLQSLWRPFIIFNQRHTALFFAKINVPRKGCDTLCRLYCPQARPCYCFPNAYYKDIKYCFYNMNKDIWNWNEILWCLRSSFSALLFNFVLSCDNNCLWSCTNLSGVLFNDTISHNTYLFVL